MTDFNLKTTADIEKIKYRLKRTQFKAKRFSIDDNFDRYISGIPYGMTVFYGEPGTGKSQMACYISNKISKKGMKVLYILAESEIDVERLNKEIITANYTIYLPKWQRVVDELYALLNYSKADLLVIDSLTKLFSETNKAIEEADLRSALSALKQELSGKIPIIAISQIRGQGMFTYPAGGRAIDHESDLLIEFDKLRYNRTFGTNKIKKSSISHTYVINVEKDKQGLAYQRSALAVTYPDDDNIVFDMISEE